MHTSRETSQTLVMKLLIKMTTRGHITIVDALNPESNLLERAADNLPTNTVMVCIPKILFCHVNEQLQNLSVSFTKKGRLLHQINRGDQKRGGAF